MMAKRLPLIAALLIGMVIPTSGAVAAVIFSNFDRNDSYHPQWYLSVGYYMEDFPPEFVDVDTAMTFTPDGRDYVLTSMEVALSIRGGTNAVDVILMSDEGGKPGRSIESVHLTGVVPPYPGVHNPVLAKSSHHPRLREGRRYWVVVSTKGPADTFIDWHVNTVQYQGLGAQRHIRGKVGDWNVSNTFAATFRVTGTPAGDIIYVDEDATGNNNGTSWTHAFNDLQDGLAAASPGHEVRVAEGIYKPDEGFGLTNNDRGASFNLIDGVTIKGGYAGAGEPEPDDRNPEVYKTILSGDLAGNDADGFANNGENSYHVVNGSGRDPSAVLDGFTITAGNANEAFPDNMGGGVLIIVGSPTLLNCSMVRNYAGRGGGAENYGYTALNPNFINCRFIANSSNVGGGMESQGGAATLLNCVFNGNHSSGSGGGLNNMGYSNIVLTNCTMIGNSAAGAGGAIYNAWATASTTVLNCIIWDNSDISGAGQAAQIRISDGAVPINYSCVMGWDGSLGGTGNIGADPMHVDPDGPDDVPGNEDDDLHLLLGSPCIDTGHPAAQYEDTDGSRNDMGAYGGPSGNVGGPGFHPGTGFIFTSVGNIPISEIVQDPGNISHGLADVNTLMAPALGIPAYADTAFGRTLWLHGLFGEHDDVNHYQILVGKWNDGNEPAPEDYVTISDSLTKVRYFIDPCHGTWTYEYVTLGPQTIDEIPNLYELTDTGYWSHIDLRARWNTRAYENGKYTVTHRAYRDVGGSLVDVTQPIPIELVLVVDNSPVDANINDVKHDPCSPYYDGDTDGDIPECGIINMVDGNDNLRFTITAWHPNGYLREYRLSALYGKDKSLGYVVRDKYVGVHDATPPLWEGVMYEEFNSADAPPGQLQPWQTCAFAFRLQAWGRVTNGFNWVGYDESNDHYYLDVGSCAWCGGADINNSWLDSCGPTCEE